MYRLLRPILGERISRTGRVIEVLTEGDEVFAVLRFNGAHCHTTVSRQVLKSAGVVPVEAGTVFTATVYEHAISPHELKPADFQPLEHEGEM